MEAQTARTYRFGVFEADAAAGELRKQGRRLRLTGQPFEVLVLLLERPGQVVTREEIHQQLWPDGTFVDFDHGLNTAINKLRESLGDSATNPRFIETLPRKGYRFIAPVEAVSQEAITEPDGRPDVEPAPNKESSEPAEEHRIGQNGANRTFLTQPDEVSQAPPGTVRALFVLAQIMYLCFYIAALARLGEAERILEGATRYSYIALIVLIVTAAIGIPVRLFLLSSIIFRAPGANRKYLKLFPVSFVLDEVWALAPFLLLEQIGFGLALAATAALLYLPFAQRSLILMGAADFKSGCSPQSER